MKYAEFEQIETESLLLRKFRKDDAESFFQRVGGSEQVTRYMLWQPHKSVLESQESIEKILSRYDGENGYTWAIALREDDSIIGRVDLLRFDEEGSSCSFAYMIGEKFWGKGFGTETLRAIFVFAFGKLDIHKIVADHMSENVASGKVMQKAGMHYVGKQLAKYEKNGKVYDADEYEIMLEDWQQREVS